MFCRCLQGVNDGWVLQALTSSTASNDDPLVADGEKIGHLERRQVERHFCVWESVRWRCAIASGPLWKGDLRMRAWPPASEPLDGIGQAGARGPMKSLDRFHGELSRDRSEITWAASDSQPVSNDLASLPSIIPFSTSNMSLQGKICIVTVGLVDPDTS
jgi:hypothetical protein